MHRNSKIWTNQELRQYNDKSEEPQPQQKQVSKGQCKSHVNSAKETVLGSKHAGFINKGNTCYINAILQGLSVIPSFWNQQSSQCGVISPFLRALTLNLFFFRKAKLTNRSSKLFKSFSKDNH